MKNRNTYLVMVCLALASVGHLFEITAYADAPQDLHAPWAYDPGPDLRDPQQKELVDHIADIPALPTLSQEVMGEQFFRPDFGPTFYRMVLRPNTVKILFIGQDATHISEASGRTATAGFGGRAQDLARHFGVNEGAAFINTYPFTIRTQYGAIKTPFLVEMDHPKLKKKALRYCLSRVQENRKFCQDRFVSNHLWLLSQHQSSPLTQWRNEFIDWIIRNNKKSLRLIVTFGGSARDTLGSYIESKPGTDVEGVWEESIEAFHIPLTEEKYTVKNQIFPAPLDRDGRDIYFQLTSDFIDYKFPEDQEKALDLFRSDFDRLLEKMVFASSGPLKNGLLDPAQLGGFDLDRIFIDGKKTRSLNGIILNDGEVLDQDILVVDLPHPTYLSNNARKRGYAYASRLVERNLDDIRGEAKRLKWSIEPDPGLRNEFAEDKAYRYGRTELDPFYYDFGTPESRMVAISSASRLESHVVVVGTREAWGSDFDKTDLEKMENATPAQKLSSEELWTARPRSPERRYEWDAGPGEKYARLMIENLDQKALFRPKKDKSWAKKGSSDYEDKPERIADGIDAFYVKSHPSHGDFGHYRGTFQDPQVVILADPAGYDDLMTARALTGERGQYLHGLMRDLGVGDQYLVIKTVPVAMDDAGPEDWAYVLEHTREYREKLFAALWEDTSPRLLITDGAYAAQALSALELPAGLAVVALERGERADAGLEQGAARIRELKLFGRFQASLERADIPRSHLSFYARNWEGTSGDRVLPVKKSSPLRGLAFGIVVPDWVTRQRPGLRPKFRDAVNTIEEIIQENRFRRPREKIPRYLKRIGA